MGIFAPSGVSNVTTSNDDLLVSTPTISNVTLGSANTESSIALPSGTKKFRLRARGSAKLQLAYNSGNSDSTYFTIMPGNVYTENHINSTASLTIYIQSNTASATVELVAWS